MICGTLLQGYSCFYILLLLDPGILMIIAWAGLASIGLTIARYFKPVFPGTKICDDKPIWFAVSILVHSDFIAVHQSTSANASLSQQLNVLRIFVRITWVVMQKTSIGRHQPMQNDRSLNAPQVF